MRNGIVYQTTGDSDRATMCNYHRKPSALNHNWGAHEVDVKNIKRFVKGDRRNGYQSPYTIGFEVEKSEFGRGQQKEYALFCGFERDGSCGVEAVTNILPLLPPSQWRNKVFDMMYQAKGIIEDDYSPSNQRCGGHITVAVDGMTGDELRGAIRLNASIFLALFRKRLTNHYCSKNIKMRSEDAARALLDSNPRFNDWHRKYQMALVKGECLEFRVPSRVRSVKQMMRRYELMYHIVDFSVTKPNGKFSALLRTVEPILLSMYEGDTEKVEQIKFLSKEFYKWMKSGDDGMPSRHIAEYIF